MPITDIPALSMLRTRMQWHQERQRVLAENIANSDTSGFKPRDLVEPNFDRSLATPVSSLSMARTSSAHFSATGGGESFPTTTKAGYETRPAGNAVSLEDEMQKSASNQMDFAAATSLYSRSLGLLKTAIGKR
ncbi:flagellar basal body rod protein FlgB [Bradyrhizobium prioriisuperbiae]|uniref:flagellar basal body rod protein FlgB n=1 Tax=Bradyrhizobium prioriisuperbiae TaxID=2854389 RepID=UPI0028E32AFC|nr:flagellar basal body rod protein FlgB [Bradyrhizobium prioritasuperba]